MLVMAMLDVGAEMQSEDLVVQHARLAHKLPELTVEAIEPLRIQVQGCAHRLHCTNRMHAVHKPLEDDVVRRDIDCSEIHRQNCQPCFEL